jgi:hypothetical protein
MSQIVEEVTSSRLDCICFSGGLAACPHSGNKYPLKVGLSWTATKVVTYKSHLR